jgi:hypothetical protein
MNKDELIRRMIKNTGRRAIREIAACLFIVAIFGNDLRHLHGNEARFYGCLLIVISAIVIAGIVWAFTLNENLLRHHPTADSAFWHDVFLKQSRLLRLVPLWYLAPLATGIILFSLPTSPDRLSFFLVNLIVIAIVCGVLAWLNRAAAARIEEQARVLSA